MNTNIKQVRETLYFKNGPQYINKGNELTHRKPDQESQ